MFNLWSLIKLTYYIEPLTVYGEGNYPLSSVKEINVTKEFIGLDQNKRKCQIHETFGDCTSQIYLKKVKELCQCIPYELTNLTKNTQENICNTEGLQCSEKIKVESCVPPCEGIYVEVKKQPATDISTDSFLLVRKDYELYKSFFEISKNGES